MSQRKSKGSAITEFGPALFLFLIVIFFPLMDILGMAAVYCCGWYSNFITTRELAVRTAADGGLGTPPPAKDAGRSATTTGGTVANEVNTEFLKTGIASFVGVTAAGLTHAVTYIGPTSAGDPPQVECRTTVRSKPFLTIPFIPNVPGLSADIDFTMAATRPREVTN